MADITALHDEEGTVIGFTKLTKEIRDNELYSNFKFHSLLFTLFG
jgi:hypothetical protein